MNLEDEISQLRASQSAQGDVSQLRLDYQKSCQERIDLSKSFEDLMKEKEDLVDEISLLKETLKSKTEEHEKREQRVVKS